MQEEVVIDITLPELYRVDEKVHTGIKIIIKSEERCVMQSEPKLVQDMALLCDAPPPLQTNAQAQPMTEQEISLSDSANIGKLIPITHAGRRKTEI